MRRARISRLRMFGAFRLVHRRCEHRLLAETSRLLASGRRDSLEALWFGERRRSRFGVVGTSHRYQHPGAAVLVAAQLSCAQSR
jgi:hypothetical protein